MKRKFTHRDTIIVYFASTT